MTADQDGPGTDNSDAQPASYVLPGVTFVPAAKVTPCPFPCDRCRATGRQT
ncbi:hypothetical protein ACFVT2_34910 [Streptomyces sp. NPDC058000]|uniref:hypothetical protein n=1 Tax=Streptomyces sp. NPDC058000 TaxID=3346299 RepID=UPI0036E08182